MVVNDNAGYLRPRSVIGYIASVLAPTGRIRCAGIYGLTMILPIICGCSAQKYSNSPGVLNTQE